MKPLPERVVDVYLHHPFLAVSLAVALLMAWAYIRLRRRGLLERSRLAWPLALLTAAQGLCAVAEAGWAVGLRAALDVGAVIMAVVWTMSRPLFPAPLHTRLWLGVIAAACIGEIIVHFVGPLAN